MHPSVVTPTQIKPFLFYTIPFNYITEAFAHKYTHVCSMYTAFTSFAHSFRPSTKQPNATYALRHLQKDCLISTAKDLSPGGTFISYILMNLNGQQNCSCGLHAEAPTQITAGRDAVSNLPPYFRWRVPISSPRSLTVPVGKCKIGIPEEHLLDVSWLQSARHTRECNGKVGKLKHEIQGQDDRAVFVPTFVVVVLSPPFPTKDAKRPIISKIIPCDNPVV